MVQPSITDGRVRDLKQSYDSKVCNAFYVLCHTERISKMSEDRIECISICFKSDSLLASSEDYWSFVLFCGFWEFHVSNYQHAPLSLLVLRQIVSRLCSTSNETHSGSPARQKTVTSVDVMTILQVNLIFWYVNNLPNGHYDLLILADSWYATTGGNRQSCSSCPFKQRCPHLLSVHLWWFISALHTQGNCKAILGVPFFFFLLLLFLKLL